jgi:hypothetical protein
MDEITIVYGKTNGTIFVRVSKKTAGQFGILSRKSGFIEVDTEANALALKSKLDSNELAARFGDLNAQGNYEVTVHAVAAVAAVATPAGELTTEA